MAYRILSSTASMDSAMKLRDAIEKRLGMSPKTILVSKDAGVCNDHTVLMRYGCAYGSLNNEPVWGSKNFSALCIDKFKFSEAFKELIKVPLFSKNSFPKEFPVLIRSTLTGSQSQGIKVVHNEQEFMENWSNGYFWTKYWKFNAEIRVYAVFTESGLGWRVYKKVPRDTQNYGDDFICGANGEDNTKWILKDANAYPKVRSILDKMKPEIMSRGGRFAALDMIYVPDLNDYVTLELNSGPWLTLTTADWLAQIFIHNEWNKYS